MTRIKTNKQTLKHCDFKRTAKSGITRDSERQPGRWEENQESGPKKPSEGLFFFFFVGEYQIKLRCHRRLYLRNIH